MSVRTDLVEVACNGPGQGVECPDSAAMATYGTALEVRAALREQNWRTGLPGGKDLCPVCRTGRPCSYPGCGRPTAYMPHPDGLGGGWRHVDPADEADSHVGYPMPRGAS